MPAALLQVNDELMHPPSKQILVIPIPIFLHKLRSPGDLTGAS